MNMNERAALYEAELVRMDAEGKKFNSKAFIFSSLYFWRKGMSEAFCLFAFLPILLMLPFIGIGHMGVAFLIGFIISHIIAGAVADSLLQKHMTKYVERARNAEENLDAPVSYFAVSVLRVVVCYILTFGLYILYWGYKNWDNVQKATKEDIKPVVNAWFICFTAPSLFSRMGKEVGNKAAYTWCGVGYMLSYLGYAFCLRYIEKMNEYDSFLGQMLVVCWGCFFVSLLCLVLMQRAVNKYTRDVLKQPMEKRFARGEIIVVVLGVLANVLGYISEDTPTLTDAQGEQIMSHSVVIYRNTKAYSEVCESEGYKLKKYPKEFMAYYGEEIAEFDNKLAPYGFSLETVEREFMNDELKQAVLKSVKEELADMQEGYIREAIAEEEGIDFDDVEWNEEWREAVPMAEICEVFDEYMTRLLHERALEYHFQIDGL